MRVEELMKMNIETCTANQTLDGVADTMWRKNCGCVPVIDENGRPIAMITDRDVCMAAYTQGKPLSAICVSTAMSKEIVTCRTGDTVTRAETLMRDHQVRRLPVIDGNGKIVGMLSLNDIATHGHLNLGKLAPVHDPLGAHAIASTLSAICMHPPVAAQAAE
jgi:CBS domain-containing protein